MGGQSERRAEEEALKGAAEADLWRDTASELVAQATGLEEEGRPLEAAELLEQAVALFQHVEGPESTEAARVGQQLANLHHAAGDLDTAETWLSWSLEVFRVALGPVHEEVATGLVALGQVLLDRGELERGERLLFDALAQWDALCGRSSLEAADVLARLGLVADALGHHVAASERYAEAVRLRRALLGEANSELAPDLIHLAQLHLASSRLVEAELALHDAEAIAGASGDGASLATLYGVLGQVRQRIGRHEEAEAAFRKSIQVFDELGEQLGEEPHELPVAISNLAHLLIGQRRDEEAEPLLLRTVELFGRLHGEQDAAVAAARADLGILSLRGGRLEEARDHFEACHDARRDRLGPDHVDTAIASNNLALVENRLGLCVQAEQRLNGAIETLRAHYGPDHPVLSIVLANRAGWIAARGDLATAEELLLEALRGLEARRPGDPRTRILRDRLTRIRRKLKEAP